MSEIRTFRLNGYDLMNSPEFYLRVDDNNGRALCKLALDHYGLYYYRPKSQVLTMKENARTRNTPHYYLTMEELKDIFEALMKIGSPNEDEEPRRLEIVRHRNEVIIRRK